MSALVHNPRTSRFEAHVDGPLGVADDRLEGDMMVLHHTGVPVALRAAR